MNRFLKHCSMCFLVLLMASGCADSPTMDQPDRATRIALLIPADSAKSVSPDLQELIVRFDRSTISGFSIRTHGPNPQTEKPYWRQSDELVIPVPLDLDSGYVIELNDGDRTMGMWRELTFPTNSLKNSVLVIEDERADILIDPLRWRILEILGDGKSVAEISQMLGDTDARVLYHLQQLVQTGAVHLEEDGADPREWRCLPAVDTIRVRESLPADDQISEAIPAGVVSQFNQASLEAAEGLYGPTFQMAINHNRARLSEEQAAEFSRRLLALIEDYFPPGKGDRSGIKYGFYGILTPIDLHPLGDSAPQE